MQASVPGGATCRLGGALLPFGAFLRVVAAPAPLPQRGLLCQGGLHVRRDGDGVRIRIWRRRRPEQLLPDKSQHVGHDAALPSLRGGRGRVPALRSPLHQHGRSRPRGTAPSVHHGSQTTV